MVILSTSISFNSFRKFTSAINAFADFQEISLILRKTRPHVHGIMSRETILPTPKLLITLTPRPDQAPTGPWAQSGVRVPLMGPQSLSMDLFGYLSVNCLSYERINFLFLSSLFFFSLLFLPFPFFHSQFYLVLLFWEASSRCGALLGAGPWARAQWALKLIWHTLTLSTRRRIRRLFRRLWAVWRNS